MEVWILKMPDLADIAKLTCLIREGLLLEGKRVKLYLACPFSGVALHCFKLSLSIFCSFSNKAPDGNNPFLFSKTAYRGPKYS